MKSCNNYTYSLRHGAAQDFSFKNTFKKIFFMEMKFTSEITA